jgi:hypothetical protein
MSLVPGARLGVFEIVARLWYEELKHRVPTTK